MNNEWKVQPEPRLRPGAGTARPGTRRSSGGTGGVGAPQKLTQALRCSRDGGQAALAASSLILPGVWGWRQAQHGTQRVFSRTTWERVALTLTPSRV